MTERPERQIGLSPYLTIRGGRGQEAIDWYGKALGAQVLFSAPAEDGKRLMHATLSVNNGWLLLSDDFPEFTGAESLPPASVILHLTVDDADTWWDRIVAAGGEVTMPLDNQFWGARYGQFRDPFGHRWSIDGPVKE